MFLFGELPFSPHLATDSAQNDGNNLDGPLNPNKKKMKKRTISNAYQIPPAVMVNEKTNIKNTKATQNG